MRKWIAALGIAAAVAGLASLIPVAASNASDNDALAGVRRATRGFQDVDNAIDAGYTQFFGCVHQPLQGSMGIHFVNGALAGDAVVDPSRPRPSSTNRG